MLWILTRRRGRTAAADLDAERQARLEAALRAMLEDCPVPDSLREFVETLDDAEAPAEPDADA